MRRLKTLRRPPIYPKTPGHLPCSSLTHPLPLSSRRPSVSFGGFGLRDHHGQTDPAEALERHARNIGLQSPNHLVRAWLAGYLILILDGFDEFAIAGWSGQAKRLRDIRFKSMELIRKFMRGPSGTGVIVAGRQHYFDSDDELTNALGLSHNSTSLYIDDFTDSQIREFLIKKGWQEGIPAWLPSRPLLLGYLCARDMLKEVM